MTSLPVLLGIRNVLVLATGMHAFYDYIGYPAFTEGPSMLPTIAVQGDMVWTSTRYRRGRGIVVGDIVSLRHPWDPEEFVSKRVLGMPGDFVLRDTPRALQRHEKKHVEGLGRMDGAGDEGNEQMMIQVWNF